MKKKGLEVEQEEGWKHRKEGERMLEKIREEEKRKEGLSWEE